METFRLTVNEEDIERAGGIIREGGLVAFPTETVYGLGADALNAEAVASVYRAKGRPSDNPMIVHIADAAELRGLTEGGADAISADAEKLIGSLWPGPLTMIFRKDPKVPDVTTGGLDTVAVRMPSNETARRLITAAGTPVAAPSANLSGRPSPTTAEDVLEDMDGRIDAVIMGEQCDVGIESTVLDLTGDVPQILRPGIVTAEKLSEVLGKEVVYDPHLLKTGKDRAEEKAPEVMQVRSGGGPGAQEDAAKGDGHDAGDNTAEEEFRPKSPGMKYKHYSPKARVRLIKGSADEFREKSTALGLEARERGERAAVIDYGNDAARAAHKLFADLRELDRQGYDIILIRTLEEKGFGFSVMNRMLRSAGFDIVE